MGRPAFSFEQVRTFVAVAEASNLTEAARAVDLTQGAVTQQLRHFERALDLQLLERDGRRLRLTPAGRAVAAACSAAARELQAIEETARLQRTLEGGILRIGAGPTSAAHYLPPLLRDFALRHPAVEMTVEAGNTPTIADKVSTGELDLGLIEGSADNPRLEERLWVQDELAVVTGVQHELAREPLLEVTALSGFRYLAREPESALEHAAAEMLGDAHRAAHRLVFNQLEGVRAAALEGLGYAVLPVIAIERDLQEGSLVRLPLPSMKRWLRAIRRQGSRLPSVERFWSLLPPEPSLA